MFSIFWLLVFLQLWHLYDAYVVAIVAYKTFQELQTSVRSLEFTTRQMDSLQVFHLLTSGHWPFYLASFTFSMFSVNLLSSECLTDGDLLSLPAL